MQNIVHTLFPTHEEREADTMTPLDVPIPYFTEDELTKAARSLKNQKAPGPDGIPAEIF